MFPKSIYQHLLLNVVHRWQFVSALAVIALIASLLGAAPTNAGTLSPNFTDFEEEGFAHGSSVDDLQPDGTTISPSMSFGDSCRQAWFVPTEATDEEIVDLGSSDLHGKVWRISTAVDGGSLGQNPHSPRNPDNISGEIPSLPNDACGTSTTTSYYAEMDFRSATGGSQAGLRLLIGANSGDTRQAVVQIDDSGTGFDLTYFPTANGCTFPPTLFATNLPYVWHTLGIEIFFDSGLASGTVGQPGAFGNDIVNIYVDNILAHTSTTWESCVGARVVDQVLFETRNENLSFNGDGLYFDNVLVTETCPADHCITDDEGPVTSNVVATPNPVAVGANVDLTASVDDSATGNSDIDSAEYSLDGGPWTEMSAQDSAFDEVQEDVQASFTAPDNAAIFDLCVRGSDVAENVGAERCIMLVVYDPEGGFVTGGGWFDSLAGAYDGDNGTIRIDANPDDGWVFNAEPPFVTPAGFSGEEASIGSGSIHVEPITNVGGTDPNAKFILRYVPDSETLVEDFQSFSIDFLIDDDDSSQVNQFYVNFYTLTPDPGDGSWYDCRFDYIASTGSTSAWTPLLFSTADPADSKGDNLGGTCPSSPSDMPAGSTVLFISVNLGDTSLNDSGVGGYYDNAQLTVGGSTTIWDFEEPLTGKASFGFVSKYKKGANVPTGNTEFQFKAADLNFHSGTYDWLVVTGSDYAKFKGEGTINGELDPNGNSFKFMIWAGDDEPDTFRIKIWWEDNGNEVVVYDNGMDQPIGGGSIVIHTK